MLYDVKTPEAYFESIEKDWRKEKITELKAMIMAVPDMEEGIGYKMLSYSKGGEAIFHLNAQMNHVGLYIGDIDKADPNGEFTAGLNRGKGCIRFKKTDKLSETRINEFIKRVIDLAGKGVDIAC